MLHLTVLGSGSSGNCAVITSGSTTLLLDAGLSAKQIVLRLESIGLTHRAIPVMLEKLQAVTAEQVRQVAEEILQDDSLTVAVLDPQPLSGKPKAPQGVSHAH